MTPDASDTEGFFAAAAAYAKQARAAVEAARALDSLPDGAFLQGAVTVGTGDDAFAGDVLVGCFGDRLAVPVVTSSQAQLPGFVGPGILVVAVSHDGEDLETVAAAREAVHRGAQVLAVCAGGELAEAAVEHGFGVVGLPRAAAARVLPAALALTLVVVSERLGLLGDIGTDVSEAYEVLEAAAGRFAVGTDEEQNLALRLARKLAGRIPLVHGSTGPSAVAARRFRNMVNENAKVPAFWNTHPHASMVEVAGWEGMARTTRELFVVVAMRDRTEDWRVARRFAELREIAADSVVDVVDVRSGAGTPLGTCFDLVATADWTSLHLAALAGVDPGPVEASDLVDERLREP